MLKKNILIKTVSILCLALLFSGNIYLTGAGEEIPDI